MQPKDQIMARMYVVITLVSLVPILVGFQVLRITVLEGRELRTTAEEQSTEYDTIPANRGIIMDAQGRPVANNIERYEIAVDPTAYGYQQGADEYFERVSDITDISVSELRRKVANRPGRQYVVMDKNVILTKDDADYLRDVPFGRLVRTTKRQYNYGSTGAHLVGFTSQYEGLAGLEYQYNEELKGRPGKRVQRASGRGISTPLPGGVIEEPVHGASLVLTVDFTHQAIMEEELKKGTIEARAEWGAAIAVDVNTGAILAMANYPTFNPNSPSPRGEGQRNHVVADMMEPGSTFKVVPAVTALETHVVTMDTIVDTGDGYLRHHGWDLKDTHPHGKISYAEVIKVSSNIGTGLVSDSTDRGELYQYARAFGFNQKTRIDLPGETGGTVIKKLPEWHASMASSLSRGYGINATMLQLALAYGALANGGVLRRPYVVQKMLDADGNTMWEKQRDSVRVVFDKETAQKLIPAFESVLHEGGTATKAAVEGLRIAGKTGTAMVNKDSGIGYKKGVYRASFVGFYPVENPQVVMLVVMHNPDKSIYGGQVSAPVFRNTTKRWLATMPNVAAYLAPDSLKIEDEMPRVPSLAGKPAPLASRMAKVHGLKESTATGFAAVVEAQNVAPGEEAWPGRPIRLETATDTTGVMPDLSGLGMRDAASWLGHLGVKVSIEGHGVVRAQSPAPGSPLPAVASISLN